MIKEEYSTVQVTERRHITDICTCCICNKLIYKRTMVDSEELPKNNLMTDYWQVTTGHNDWGNDSVDSISTYEICSEDCLKTLMIKYIEGCTKRSRRNSWYMDINHEVICGFEIGEGRKSLI